MFNIITVNCNTIVTHGADSTDNWSTNTAICQTSGKMKHYTNIMQEADRAEKRYSNTDSISKFENKDKPMVSDKEPNTTNYILPGPNRDNDKRVSDETTQQL